MRQLQEGDRVIRYAHGKYRDEPITIDRVTKTQANAGYIKVKRQLDSFNGTYEIGGYSRGYYKLLTPELEIEVNEQKNRDKVYLFVANTSFNSLSTDQLTRIAAIINEPKQ